MIHINLTPNTEGQFNDIPTKIRTKDQWFMYTSHKQELIKPILTDFFFNFKFLPEFSNLKVTNFGQN